MIPRETSLEFVRISNIHQRMTEAEISRFDEVLAELNITPFSLPKQGRCIRGEDYNNAIRPTMLNLRKKVYLCEATPQEIADEVRRRGWKATIIIPSYELKI